MNAIEVVGLAKSYGNHQVLKNISFTVNQGDVFALLGINGAGKTTTLECLEGLRKYEAGTIRMEGRFGVQLQSSSIPSNMKVIEAITLFSKWQKVSVSQDDIVKLGITPFLNKQYNQLSTGQKRRLHLFLALLGDPDIIFLDEPTAGLDVKGRVAIHEEIQNLKEKGKTILLASHDMSEVEELCNHVVILKDGIIAFDGSTKEVTKQVQTSYHVSIYFSKDFNTLPFGTKSDKDTSCYVFETENIEDTLLEIIKFAKAEQITIKDIQVERMGLQQRFLEIAKEKDHERTTI